MQYTKDGRSTVSILVIVLLLVLNLLAIGIIHCYRNQVLKQTRSIAYIKKQELLSINQSQSMQSCAINHVSVLDLNAENDSEIINSVYNRQDNVLGEQSNFLMTSSDAIEKKVLAEVDVIDPLVSLCHTTYKKKKNRAASIKKRRLRKSKDSVHIAWPIRLDKFWVSSYYGPRKKGFHNGIDMAAVRGTPINPAANGMVEFAGWASGYGRLIIVNHGKKIKTRYAHLDRIDVRVGQVVHVTDVIGIVGDSGYTIAQGRDASHLHFEVCVDEKQMNPLDYLPQLVRAS